MTFLVEIDKSGQVALPGQPGEKFLVTENPDGSLLLEPALVMTKAQYDFDTDPVLQDLLHRAAVSQTVQRPSPPTGISPA